MLLLILPVRAPSFARPIMDIDDSELRLDAAGKAIHVRSASRVGKGDPAGNAVMSESPDAPSEQLRESERTSSYEGLLARLAEFEQQRIPLLERHGKDGPMEPLFGVGVRPGLRPSGVANRPLGPSSEFAGSAPSIQTSDC